MEGLCGYVWAQVHIWFEDIVSVVLKLREEKTGLNWTADLELFIRDKN
jgi:hypothetical protein